MQFEFETFDVFTRQRFAGNPLAVVWDADALTATQMQTITREFNLSETVFIRAAQDARNAAQLRIFTPGYELPFAGHPTVGAAIAIARRRRASGQLFIELKAGLFPVDVTLSSDGGYATFTNPNPPTSLGQAPTADIIEQALSLQRGAVDRAAHAPRTIAAGVSYVYAHTSFEMLGNAKLDSAAFELLSLADTVGVVLYTESPDDSADYRVRMFAPGAGVAEDPATGSAAAAFPGQLVASGQYKDGSYKLRVHQGAEMGRPSELRVQFDVVAGAARNVRVGGDAIIVQTGRISV